MVRVVPGKDAHTVERFVQDFMDRNGDPNRVGLVTCDISLEFARGICEHLPNAAKVIDKFHTSSSTPTRPSTGVAGPRAGTTRNTCVCATKQTHPNPNWRSSAACGGVGPGPLGPAGCVSPAGHLRRQRRPDRDRNGGQSIALADDALPSGSHEGLGPTATPSLGRRSRLLRSSVRQRNPRGPEQHHPERKNPRKGLQEHELLQRDDLPAANSIYEPSLPDRLHPHQTAKGHRADRTKFLDDFLAILKEYRASLPQPIFSKLVSSQAVRKIQKTRKFSDGND